MKQKLLVFFKMKLLSNKNFSYRIFSLEVCLERKCLGALKQNIKVCVRLLLYLDERILTAWSPADRMTGSLNTWRGFSETVSSFQSFRCD